MKQTQYVIAAAAVLLAIAAPSGAHISSRNGYVSADVRGFGAVCDGSTDDEVAIEAAYDALTTNGGTLVIPSGLTCLVDADVEVESNVQVVCEEGAGFVATGGTFTNGMFSATAKTDSGFTGCDWDLATKATAAVYSTGNSAAITFRNNRVFNGATTAAANHSLVNLSCDHATNTGIACGWIEDNRVECASHANETGDNGITAAVGTDNDDHNWSVSGNHVIDCDGIGIFADGYSSVAENFIWSEGATAVGLELRGQYARAKGNWVGSSGADGVAFSGTGNGQAWATNTTVLDGVRSVGWSLLGAAAAQQTLTGNKHHFTASADDGVGVLSSASAVVINGHNATVATGQDCDVQIAINGQQSEVTGSEISGCAYGLAPFGGTAAEDFEADTVNVRYIGNIVYGQTVAGIVLATGSHAYGNAINWQGASAVGILLCDDRTYGPSCTTHSHIVGNNFFCSACVANIQAPEVGFRCIGGTEAWKDCSASGGGGSCAGGGTCTAQVLSGVAIQANDFIGTGTYEIDLGASWVSVNDVDAPDITNFGIGGGNFYQLGTTTHIAFPDGTGVVVSKIELGENLYPAGGTYLLNWDPSMGVNRNLQEQACVILENVAASTDDKLGPVVPDAVTLTGATCWCHDPDGAGDSPPFECGGATTATFRFTEIDTTVIGDSISCNTASDSTAAVTTFGTAYDTVSGEAVLLDTTNTPTDTDEVYEICLLYE